MVNRRIPPKIKAIDTIPLPNLKIHRLGNGIPIYEIEAGTQEVIKFEVVFNAGRPYEDRQLVGKATNSLLKEGTKQYSAADISEKIDFYGCTLNMPYNLDFSNIALFSLKKHFPTVLPILVSIIENPLFPREELASFINRSIEKLKVELVKSDVVAYRVVTEKIFGAQHPYGYNSFPQTYRDLRREHLIAHHDKCYTAENCKIFISGHTKGMIPMLEATFGNLRPGSKAIPHAFPDNSQLPTSLKIKHPNPYQSAIRIGRKLFSRSHPDYPGFYVLNTILGGYFGSRLMTNIREEKGYTYHIYSSVDTMAQDGYFYIGAEVSNEMIDNSLTEIYKELDQLKTHLVDHEELSMVKSYLLGNFLTMLDGPFSTSEVVKALILEELPVEHIEQVVNSIKNITPEAIRSLAQTYLEREEMWEVIVTGQ